MTSLQTPVSTCSQTSGKSSNTQKNANGASADIANGDTLSALATSLSDIDVFSAPQPETPVCLTACSSFWTADNNIVCRDLTNNAAGTATNAAAATALAVCENGAAQVLAGILATHVCVWEIAASGDNVAFSLPVSDIAVLDLAVNERFVVVLESQGVHYFEYATVYAYEVTPAWSFVHVNNASTMSFDGHYTSLLWLATTCGPRLVDLNMGPACVAVLPIHLDGSPWTTHDLYQDALAMCKRPIDIAKLHGARSRRGVGPEVYKVAAHKDLSVYGCSDKCHVVCSKGGSYFVFNMIAQNVSVNHKVYVGTNDAIYVIDRYGAILHSITILETVKKIVAIPQGVRFMTKDAITTILCTKDLYKIFATFQ